MKLNLAFTAKLQKSPKQGGWTQCHLAAFRKICRHTWFG